MLLTEHHWEFLRLKEAAQVRLSVHLSKWHIVGNHMSRLILVLASSYWSVEIAGVYFYSSLHLWMSRFYFGKNKVSSVTQ